MTAQRIVPTAKEPFIDRSITLHLIGDWGQANWHRIMGWISQEFGDRTGPSSRTAIWSMRGGGWESFELVFKGEADVAISTPANLMGNAIHGTSWFEGRPMPSLRALGTIPQDDRLVLAIDPKLGCKTFADIREKKPALKVSCCPDRPDSVIGYITGRFLEAHGLSAETIRSWGGEFITSERAEQTIVPAQDPNSPINCVIQEAIMSQWWTELIEGERAFIPIPAEPEALQRVTANVLSGLKPDTLPPGYWKSLNAELPCLSFRDFVLFCRDDLPEDVAYLLAWIIVNTRESLHKQFQHIPFRSRPISTPMVPKEVAKACLPLHRGARRFYEENNLL